MAQNQFARPVAGRVSLIEPITPIVKNPSTDSEFLRELPDVVARLHSFDRLPSKLVAIPLPFSVFHFAAPFPQSVHDETVSWLDVHSSPSPRDRSVDQAGQAVQVSAQYAPLQYEAG